VVWGALAERRAQLCTLMHAILDALAAQTAAAAFLYTASSTGGRGVGAGAGRAGEAREEELAVDLWGVYLLLRSNWCSTLPYPTLPSSALPYPTNPLGGYICCGRHCNRAPYTLHSTP